MPEPAYEPTMEQEEETEDGELENTVLEVAQDEEGND